MAAPMELAAGWGAVSRLYANGKAGDGALDPSDVEAIPRRVDVELEAARLVSGNMVHAGDTVVVEATLRPWRQAARNVRITVKLPARLGAGNLRLLVSDAGRWTGRWTSRASKATCRTWTRRWPRRAASTRRTAST
jgi:hypothetical protein